LVDGGIMSKEKLEVKNLDVYVGKKQMLYGISLEIGAGEIHVLMGPNGSGKSTLANVIMGLPGYSVKGKLLLSSKDFSKMSITERARAGIFLAFQNSPEIDSVKNANFMRQASLSCGKNVEASQFKREFEEVLNRVGLNAEFYDRPVNFGFSGGEKKKNELAQLIMLNPKFAILDEIDSGLDVDSIKRAVNIVKALAAEGKGILLITHSPLLLKYLTPKRIYVMSNGRIVKQGGHEILSKIEREGFTAFDKRM